MKPRFHYGQFLTPTLSFILSHLIWIHFYYYQKKIYAKKTRVKLGDANYFLLDTQGALENGIPTQQTALWVFFPASSLITRSQTTGVSHVANGARVCIEIAASSSFAFQALLNAS